MLARKKIILGAFILSFISAIAIKYYVQAAAIQAQNPTTTPVNYTLQQDHAIDISSIELLQRLDQEYINLADAVTPSVVSLETSVNRVRGVGRDFFGRNLFQSYQQNSAGSGVIISKEGHIITNHHVINDQDEIYVILSDGRRYKSEVIGSDSMLDIAVLKIEDKKEFNPLKFGDSDKVKVGQQVLAIGNPFGLGETVTRGIISAKNRELGDQMIPVFQTDASINPGNSGGPLINLQGEIIAINVAIYSQSANQGFQGIGFSIPANEVLSVVDQILKKGKVIKGFLGVSFANVTNTEGALIREVVAESPAEQAGLEPQDFVVKFNGTKLKTANHLALLVGRAPVDREVEIEVSRANKIITLKAQLATKSMPTREAVTIPYLSRQQMQQVFRHLGFFCRDINDEEKEKYQFLTGIKVMKVAAGGFSAAQGLQQGDIIYGINGQMIDSTEAFYAILLDSLNRENYSSLNIQREDERLKLDLLVE